MEVVKSENSQKSRDNEGKWLTVFHTCVVCSWSGYFTRLPLTYNAPALGTLCPFAYRIASSRYARLRSACLRYVFLRDACFRYAYLRFASLRDGSLHFASA